MRSSDILSLQAEYRYGGSFPCFRRNAGVNRNYGEKATIRNLKIKDDKPGKPRICEGYLGISKGSGRSEKYREFWNTKSCNVDSSHILKI